MKSIKINFTLIELLVAISLIAILMAMAIGGTMFAMRIASEAKCKAMIHRFEMAAESYKQKQGFYPQSSEAGGVFSIDPAGSGNFREFLDLQDKDFSGTQIKDPWGIEYAYKCPGWRNRTKFDFYSAGSDMTYNTTDDIGNFEVR